MHTERRTPLAMIAFMMIAVAAIAALATALLLDGQGTPLSATPTTSESPAATATPAATASLTRVSALGLTDAEDCDMPEADVAKAAAAPKKASSHHVHERADGSRYATFTVIEGNTVREYVTEVNGDVNVGNTLIDVDLDGDGVIDVVLGDGNTTGGNAIGSGNGNTAINVEDNNVAVDSGNTDVNVEDNIVDSGNTEVTDNVVIADNTVDSGNDNVIGSGNDNVVDSGNTDIADNVVVVDSGNGNQIGDDNVDDVDVDVTVP